MHKLYNGLIYTHSIYFCPRKQNRLLLISHLIVIQIEPQYNRFVLGLFLLAPQILIRWILHELLCGHTTTHAPSGGMKYKMCNSTNLSKSVHFPEIICCVCCVLVFVICIYRDSPKWSNRKQMQTTAIANCTKQNIIYPSDSCFHIIFFKFHITHEFFRTTELEK
jgi:hypothetical protein